jgi:hypothetical protein
MTPLKGATGGVIFIAFIFACVGAGGSWQVVKAEQTFGSSSIKVNGNVGLWKASYCVESGSKKQCKSETQNDRLAEAKKDYETLPDEQKKVIDNAEARIQTARAFSIMACLVSPLALGASVMGVGKGFPGAILCFVCSLFCVIAIGVSVCTSDSQLQGGNCLFRYKGHEDLNATSIGGPALALEILAFMLFLVGAVLAILVGRSSGDAASSGAQKKTTEVNNPGNPSNAAGMNDEL